MYVLQMLLAIINNYYYLQDNGSFIIMHYLHNNLMLYTFIIITIIMLIMIITALASIPVFHRKSPSLLFLNVKACFKYYSYTIIINAVINYIISMMLLEYYYEYH